MRGIRRPVTSRDAEDQETEASEEEGAFNAPPDTERTLTFYILIKRRTPFIFSGSTFFAARTLEDAKTQVVETVFGMDLPNTPDELLERYAVDVVELTEELEDAFEEFNADRSR